jgi:aquaporin NIP
VSAEEGDGRTAAPEPVRSGTAAPLTTEPVAAPSGPGAAAPSMADVPADAPPGRPGLARRAAAEALAAFALVFAGCGAIVADEVYGGGLGTVGVALAFGLVIMAMVYATGHLSGAHVNPAVTVAFALTRHFPAREAASYVAAQLAGAAAAALLLLAVWPDQPAELGATLPSVGAGSAFAYEVVLTAILMFVITAVATDTRAVGAGAAIAIGGTVGLGALFGGPVTGASMNPARSFGPALAAWEWSDLWVYVTAPVAGAALGAIAYQLVRGDQESQAVSSSSAPGTT